MRVLIKIPILNSVAFNMLNLSFMTYLRVIEFIVYIWIAVDLELNWITDKYDSFDSYRNYQKHNINAGGWKTIKLYLTDLESHKYWRFVKNN